MRHVVKRIQCAPDLLTKRHHRRLDLQPAREQFEFDAGPIVANVLWWTRSTALRRATQSRPP